MGTDHETSKEHTMWHKSAHRMMSAPKTLLDWHISLSEVKALIERAPFPWVLVDEESRFKGIVEQERIVQYLLSGQPVHEVHAL